MNHPFEKYARQIGSFPQVGVEKQSLKPPPRFVFFFPPLFLVKYPIDLGPKIAKETA